MLRIVHLPYRESLRVARSLASTVENQAQSGQMSVEAEACTGRNPLLD